MASPMNGHGLTSPINGAVEDDETTPLTPFDKNHSVSSPEADECEHYIRNCNRYGMKVDPSVVITLRTRWGVLQPTKAFCEGSLLPLAGILDQNSYIKRMNLSGTGVTNVKPAAGNGNSNARVLHQILSNNKAIDSLDISNTGIDDDGIFEICEGLKKNASVTALNVARNNFSAKGVHFISRMLEKNQVIRHLDISRNALGFHSINSLQCCGAARRVAMRVEGNFVFEEILNSLTHGLGFIASVVGSILLMSVAAEPGTTPYHFWSCMIFSVCLMILYLSSTLYHSFFMLPYAKDILQIFDHVGIYLLIAGSYSPFMMIALHHNTSANVLLVVQWLTTFIGICVTIATAGIGVSNQDTNFVEVTIYVAMGCAVLGVWEQVVAALPPMALRLLIAGGLAYIFGITFFVLGEVKPIFHTVWHVFVMVGSLLHWLCVYIYVAPMRIPMDAAQTLLA